MRTAAKNGPRPFHWRNGNSDSSINPSFSSDGPQKSTFAHQYSVDQFRGAGRSPRTSVPGDGFGGMHGHIHGPMAPPQDAQAAGALWGGASFGKHRAWCNGYNADRSPDPCLCQRNWKIELMMTAGARAIVVSAQCWIRLKMASKNLTAKGSFIIGNSTARQWGPCSASSAIARRRGQGWRHSGVRPRRRPFGAAAGADLRILATFGYGPVPEGKIEHARICSSGPSMDTREVTAWMDV